MQGIALAGALRDPQLMSVTLTESLPLPQRLALSYAPARMRPATLALFALDARFGQAIRQASEPIMAQMRIAWWRDQLQVPPARRERSDELVAALDLFAGEEAALRALADGWELLLSEDFSDQTASAFATARAQAFLALSRLGNTGEPTEVVLAAGQRWALADLASGLSDPEEKAIVIALAHADKVQSLCLSRAMRPLRILEGLARRSLGNGGGPLLEGPGSLLTAIRLGLTGR